LKQRLEIHKGGKISPPKRKTHPLQKMRRKWKVKEGNK